MRRTVLIVDDNRINRRLLRGILQQDYAVEEAENGREALAALRRPGADVAAVVLDLVMPVMDGYETLAAIRGESAFSQIPVVVSTGSEGGEAELRALTLGANDFILKPFNAQVVRHRVENLIRLAAAARDVEELRAEKEALRISEEQYRIAASAGGRVTARYDIKTGVYSGNAGPDAAPPFGGTAEDVPESFFAGGVVAPECAADCRAFYERLRAGERTAHADIAVPEPGGAHRWFRCDATTVFDDEGRPSQAIIVYTDITEQREKETVKPPVNRSSGTAAGQPRA